MSISHPEEWEITNFGERGDIRLFPEGEIFEEEVYLQFGHMWLPGDKRYLTLCGAWTDARLAGTSFSEWGACLQNEFFTGGTLIDLDIGGFEALRIDAPTSGGQWTMVLLDVPTGQPDLAEVIQLHMLSTPEKSAQYAADFDAIADSIQASPSSP